MFNFSRLWRLLSGSRNQGMSVAEREDMDVSVEYPLTMLDEEKFVVDGGELTGTTGLINGGAITGIHIEGKALNGVDFNFDDDKEGILAASRATSLLLVEIIDAKNVKTWQFATAFFVAPNILLTAGHVVYEPKDGGKIDRYLFMPGDPFLDMDKVSQKAPHAIRCTVAENTWKPKGPMFKDIAVLSSGSFETKNFVPISCDAIPINAIIDVVGYPGEKRSNWLREKHPGLKSLVDSTRTSEAMLPTGKLVVTRGVVEETCGDMTSYKISTCPGLSGSCVVYKGKVHGVHVGDTGLVNKTTPSELRSAVSFNGGGAKHLLRKYKLLHESS